MKHAYYEVREIKDIREMLRGSVELYGDKAAFLEKRQKQYEPISFNQFGSDTNALGTALCARGLKDKRIMVMGENGYSWALTYMAVVCGVGVIVPVDREISAEEITNIANISEASAVIYAPSSANKISECAFNENVQKIPFTMLPELIKEGAELLGNGDRTFLDAEIDPYAMGILLFTSGTTGVSKGVMLSHHNICFDLMEMCSMLYIGPEDTFLSVLPLHHTYECTCGFLCQIYRGSTIAYCEKLSLVARNMAEAKVTKMNCVPLIVETLYKKIWMGAEKSGKAATLRKAIKINNALKKVGIDMSKKLFKDIYNSFGGHLDTLISGGAAVKPEVLRGLRDLGIKAVQGYGLTECAPLAALNRDVYFKDDSAGLETPNGKLDIYNPDENGVGEIRYRGENIMLGYYNAPDLTEEVIRDGWLYTGDLGYLDSERFLHITGRKKNVIVTSNGKNIFPEEIEVYLERSEYIAESMIIGTNDPSGETLVKAIIYPNYELANEKLKETGITPESDGYTDALKAILSDVINEINLSLPTFKRIRKFVIRREEFEKTTSKKIKRFAESNLNRSDDIN